MKLDKRRNYAQVFGHAWAVYEQDGVLFNSHGDPGASKVEAPVEESPIPKLSTEEPSEIKFLKATLQNGPKVLGVVRREADEAGLAWDEVQRASTMVQKLKYKNTQLWKLSYQ